MLNRMWVKEKVDVGGEWRNAPEISRQYSPS